ncbi:unnamed protein product, partial [Adineta steineri]
MTNSAATLSSILATLTERLTYIALPFYVILGILGNTFCIIYFLNKSQRASSCAFYLLLTAITNLFAVTFGVSTSILSLAKPVVSASLVYCKL